MNNYIPAPPTPNEAKLVQGDPVRREIHGVEQFGIVLGTRMNDTQQVATVQWVGDSSTDRSVLVEGLTKLAFTAALRDARQSRDEAGNLLEIANRRLDELHHTITAQQGALQSLRKTLTQLHEDRGSRMWAIKVARGDTKLAEKIRKYVRKGAK